MLKPEADYKAKYISLLRDLGDVDLVPELVGKFRSRYAPQIEPPARFIACRDYAEFADRTRGNTDHSVNMANLIGAICSAYFGQPASRHAISTISMTVVGCGSVWMPPHSNLYEMLDVKLSFDEPTRMGRLITGPWVDKGIHTFDWLPGLAFEEMKSDYLNLAVVEFYDLLCALAENCFAFWQKGADFVACAKPTVSLDFRYRVHSDTAMAVRFPSGDGLYALRGVRIDEKYITEPVTGKQLIRERNAEVRMVLLEKYGAKLLDSMPHRVVSKRGSKLFGVISPDTRLIEMTWDNYERIRMLHLKWKDKDGTRHETLIHVPATKREFQLLGQKPPEDIDDCEEMRRWVMRLEEGDELVKET